MVGPGGPNTGTGRARGRRITAGLVLAAAVVVAVVALLGSGGGGTPRVLVTTSAQQAVAQARDNRYAAVVLVAPPATSPVAAAEQYLRHRVRSGEDRDVIAAAFAVPPQAILPAGDVKAGTDVYVPLPERFVQDGPGGGQPGAPLFRRYAPASSDADGQRLAIGAVAAPLFAPGGGRVLLAVGADEQAVATVLPATVDAVDGNGRLLRAATARPGRDGSSRFGTALRWLLLFAVGVVTVPLARLAGGLLAQPDAAGRPAASTLGPPQQPQPSGGWQRPGDHDQRAGGTRGAGPGVGVELVVSDQRVLLDDPQCRCGSFDVDGAYSCRACGRSWQVPAHAPWPDLPATGPAGAAPHAPSGPSGPAPSSDHLPRF